MSAKRYKIRGNESRKKSINLKAPTPVEAFEVFECLAVCVFYVVMICVLKISFLIPLAKVRQILI